ncbi:hypothetical protein E1B28_002283 [Marasmius oreades]|uniref:Uncharacterized protein n=1 Tax=Marasmius oreades TaxID=181124 RepID=A0A9P7RMJ2_9AGAR|nr:uncharacterized protein E1B28_002283 [Marasmius oreades]KAG7086319.1 hypothetical protein E1B28_002283 [Marasmius oreades]
MLSRVRVVDSGRRRSARFISRQGKLQKFQITTTVDPQLPKPSPAPKSVSTPITRRGKKYYTLEKAFPSTPKRFEVAYETSGLYYGPVSTNEFFQEFMPYKSPDTPRKPPTKNRRDMMKKVASKGTEEKMYKAFVKALQSWPPAQDERKIKLFYHDNHLLRDPNCAGLSVDVAVADARTERFWGGPHGKHIFFTEHESHTKFKLCVTCDPFVDPEETKERGGPGGTGTGRGGGRRKGGTGSSRSF